MNILKLFGKKSPQERKPSFGETMQPFWDSAFAAYPVGKSFEYLGRKMVVVEHIHYRRELDGCGYYYIPAQYPEIVAEYADERGEIHTHKFEVGSIEKILQNASS